MRKYNIIQNWKNPMKKTEVGTIENPVGNIFEEISDSDLQMAGGEDASNYSLIIDVDRMSKILGNKGRICTYTLECTAACNLNPNKK